jgi:ubiquinone/menaquinone biosynthesis C-methylase UbiE
MPFYRDAVFPRLMNFAMDTKSTREIRARVCKQLSGDVLEIGFGSGLNLPHLPPSVTALHAVDPSEAAAGLAQERMRATLVRVDRAGLDGQDLPFEDASMDAALSTWTLCTIADPIQALREVRRVLRPGGMLHFVEHGRAPDERVRRWQARLNLMQNRLACGCHLDRDIPALIQAVGFQIERIDEYYSKGEPRPYGATYEGVAIPG